MQNKMSLQRQLLLAFGLSGAMTLIVALAAWNSNLQLSKSINTFRYNSLPAIAGLWKVNEGQTQIESSERALLNPLLDRQGRQAEIERIKKAWEQIDAGFKQYEPTPRTEEEDRVYQQLKVSWQRWRQDHEEFIRLHEALWEQASIPNQNNNQNVWNQLNNIARKNRKSFEEATKLLLENIKINEQIAVKANQEAQQTISSSTFWIAVCTVSAPVAAMLLAWYFTNTIAKPLGAKIAGVVGVADKISRGDLTTLVPESENQDEIGKLQNSFRTMSKNLNSLITQVQKSGIQITTSATQIAASGKQLEATVTEQVASTNEVTATAKEIATTSAQLVKTMDEVEHKSQMTAQAAGDSQHELTEMEKTMRLLAEATSTIANKLGVINEKANNINSIVTTITKVADQTNLLSLNAAIEAEKAGEYGTGFAVVAREIRRLADQTAVATLDIENMVKEMQGAVATGVMEVDSFTKEVERGVEDVRNISVKLESIIEQVQTLTPRFQQVSHSVENQSQGAVQISEAMEQLSEASSQTAATLREINGAIGQLNDAAAGLRQEISNFRVV